MHVVNKKVRFAAFSKLRGLSLFIERNYLSCLGNYKVRDNYSTEKYPFRKPPVKTDDEKRRIKDGELEYLVENIKQKIKLTTEQRRNRVPDFKMITQVSKFHIHKRMWSFNSHYTDDYALMGRAIAFYVMVMAYEDNYFTIKDDNAIFNMNVRFYQDWVTLKKTNFFDLKTYDMNLGKSTDVDLRKKLHFSKDFAHSIFKIARTEFLSNEKIELDKYKENCKNIVETMIKLLTLQNNVTPLKESYFCQS